ncbi:class 3 adenylate cyclase [Lewinella marina]|uniref:Guanylate cyclase domain-containing protein n=1 Tax=Neolewinella marina TaxID=438751 RepID=A0A2G0CK60_9BACT|nr:adenylate/guanylate cyclase domain-containing protein [Neolewinella marina]NJB84444.1 class 3 adenylate cyclase [Neolewinella marina]PHL00363.1 hypothetical protein CGL56_04835 [Neolewinella marina]
MRHPLVHRLFALALLLAAAQPGRSQPVIVLDVDRGIQTVGRHTAYYRSDRELSVDEAIQLDRAGAFLPHPQDAPNFAATSDEIWFRFTVRKVSPLPFYLHLGSAFLDRVALYQMATDGPRLLRRTGDDLPFAERDVQVPSFLLSLDQRVGETRTYYLSVSSLQPLFFSMRTGTPKALFEDLHGQDFLQGIYFGFMLLIMVYNALIYVSLRERVYLYYGFYLLSITLFMGFVVQYLFQYLWPNLPQLNRYAVASAGLTIISAVLFSRHFLSTLTQAPRFHRLSRFFLGLGGLIILLVVAQFHLLALMLAQVGILLMAIFLFVLGVMVYRRGFSPAKYYLLAWGVLIGGFIAGMLESLNILPVSPHLNSMQVGSALEVTLLSFALADRINIYKRDRLEAQREALRAAQEANAVIAQQNELLEQRVQKRTRQLDETLRLVELERAKSDHLLLSILPDDIATELKERGHAEPRFFRSVSVMFMDIVQFSTLTRGLPARELVDRLDHIFICIDDIISTHRLEKIKTIGDAYMAAGGLPIIDDDHATQVVEAARDIHRCISRLPPDSHGNTWQLRIGVHSGPVVAGVVGKKKFAYDIWGETVNLASRMEANSAPGRINVSEATYSLIRHRINCTFRGQIEAKNMGQVGMYFVEEPTTL